jgi:8-oxo-dGTP pyrophosphatase MutT (NUDIX family)
MAKRGHIQIAAMPWRKSKADVEVLLIKSRETRRWVIPKGWPMDHLKDFNAAKVEAYEEAGVRGRVTRKPVGSFRYDKQMKSSELRDVTVTVYALHVQAVLTSWPEKSERPRKWFSCEAAAKAVAEPGLQKLLRGFKPE